MPEHIKRLQADYATAAEIHKIKLDDFTRIGLQGDTARQMLDELHGPSLEFLLQKLNSESLEYYGVEVQEKLAGVACIGDWMYGDEKPFLSTTEFITARLRHKAAITMDHHYKPPFDGIHSFGIATSVDIFDSVAEPLIECLRARSYDREKIGLRVAVDAEDDLLLDMFEEKGVPVSRKLGMITIGGITRGHFQYEIETV